MTRIYSRKDTPSLARNKKKLNYFKRGRINSAKEAREQLVLRNNHERRFNKRLSSLFRKFVNVNMYLYKQTGVYDASVAKQTLDQDLLPLVLSHYKRVSRATWDHNEIRYKPLTKASAFVLGRSKEFDALIDRYFRTRELVLSNISFNMSWQIRGRLAALRAEDLTLDQIARTISSEYIPITRRRAALIARTETHGAASFANHQYHQELANDTGIEMMKKWVATADDRTRSDHADANGQVVAMDEDFTVGGAKMKHAGDPRGGAKNVINCRCVIVYVDAEDELDGTPAAQVEPDDGLDPNWGDVDSVEKKFHDNAGWNNNQTIRNIIKDSPKLNEVFAKSGGAYYMPFQRKIHMPSKYNADRTNVVWKHEYGHAIDDTPKFWERLEAANILDAEDINRVKVHGHLSLGAALQIQADRKMLSGYKRAGNKERAKGFDKDYKWKRDPDFMAKEFGIDLAENGSTMTINSIDELQDKVYAFVDKGTGPLANAAVLEKLMGKDWVKKYMNDVAKGRTTSINYYLESVIDIAEGARYNNGTAWLDNAMTFSRKYGGISNDEINMFSDFIGSVSNNKFFRGHGDSYYKRYGSVVTGVNRDHAGEAFANWFALMGGDNAAFWRELLEFYVPETLKRFDDIIDAIGVIN